MEKNYYLSPLQIISPQEEALIRICYRLHKYQSETGNIVLGFDYFGEKITNPYLDCLGIFMVDPIEEYSIYFVDSEFVKLAQSFNLKKDSKDHQIEYVVRTYLLDKFKEEVKKIIDSNPKNLAEEISVLVEYFSKDLDRGVFEKN